MNDKIKKSKKEIEKMTMYATIESFYKENPPLINLSESEYNLIPTTIPEKVTTPQCTGDRFEDLDTYQKLIYINSFSQEFNGKNCVSYISIRLNEILLGFIYSYSKIDVSKLENEIQFFKNNINLSNKEFLLLEYFSNFLKTLDEESRVKRLWLLRTLDDRAPPRGFSFSGAIVITDTGGVDVEMPPPKNRIHLSSHYIDFAMDDISGILTYKETGFSRPFDLVKHDRGLNKYDKFDASKISQDRQNIDDDTPLVKKIKLISTYIDKSVALYFSIDECVRYVVRINEDFNELITILEQENDFQNVILWCDKFIAFAEKQKGYDIETMRIDILKRTQNAKSKLVV